MTDPAVRHARIYAERFGTPQVSPTGQVWLPDRQQVSRPRHRDRIVVGGRDITYFRGHATPLPGYTLVTPLGYGPATLVLPQVSPAFETLGQGALRWLRPGAAVTIQRVNAATNEVVATDYRGVILDFDVSGNALSVVVGGEASGRAALRQTQPPIFLWRKDLGRMAHDAVRELGLPFAPYLGPVTGIAVQRFGGSGHLDHISQIVALATTREGRQWTIMPTWGIDRGPYRMVRKNRTTVSGTVYTDDARSVANLRRSLAEEPSRVYVTGVTPEGMRARFGRYPGLKQTPPPPYPFRDGRPFGLGTTDADTRTGDGIAVLVYRLFITKYLTRPQLPGGYDRDVRRAVRDLQRDAGLPATGVVTRATWRAMYDLSVTGFSLRGAHIGPASEATAVRRWDRSGSGSVRSRNPRYDATRPVVDRNIDMGTGFTVEQLRQWAHAERREAQTPNWVGSVSLGLGGLVRGLHDPADPLTPADIMPARALRPGMNLHLPYFAGGLTVHISAVTVAAGTGEVTVDVDTRARESMEVWEVIARNREAARSPRREWLRQHRQSTTSKDSTTPWDEVGGVLYDSVVIPAHRWVVVPVVAGQAGTVGRLSLRTQRPAQFVTAVFGRRVSPRRLQRLIGNPLSRRGSRRWEAEGVRDRLTDRHLLLYAAGSAEQPCGYYPRQKVQPVTETNTAEDGTETETTRLREPQARLTGRWHDDASFGYRTMDAPVLYLAVYADRPTRIPRGRVMWPQLEAGT